MVASKPCGTRGSLTWDRSVMFKNNRLRKMHTHSGTHSGIRRLNTTNGRRVALQNKVCKVWDEAMMHRWEKGGGLAVLFACTNGNRTVVGEGWALDKRKAKVKCVVGRLDGFGLWWRNNKTKAFLDYFPTFATTSHQLKNQMIITG